jgi:hypothetical protein
VRAWPPAWAIRSAAQEGLILAFLDILHNDVLGPHRVKTSAVSVAISAYGDLA